MSLQGSRNLTIVDVHVDLLAIKDNYYGPINIPGLSLAGLWEIISDNSVQLVCIHASTSRTA